MLEDNIERRYKEALGASIVTLKGHITDEYITCDDSMVRRQTVSNLQMHSTSLSIDEKISYMRIVMDETYDIHCVKMFEVKTKSWNTNTLKMYFSPWAASMEANVAKDIEGIVGKVCSSVVNSGWIVVQRLNDPSFIQSSV